MISGNSGIMPQINWNYEKESSCRSRALDPIQLPLSSHNFALQREGPGRCKRTFRCRAKVISYMLKMQPKCVGYFVFLPILATLRSDRRECRSLENKSSIRAS